MKVKNQNLLNEAKIKWKKRNVLIFENCVSSSQTAYKTIIDNISTHEHYNDMQFKECSFCFYLDNKNMFCGFSLLSVGCLTSCLIDQKEITRAAILCFASGVILVHNHPSGNMEPSAPDRQITKRVKEALNLFDINLLDHFIIDVNSNNYYSFLDHGLL